MCRKQKEKKEVPHPIENMMESAMSRMRGLVDTSVVVGEPIYAGEKMCLVPISKVSMGFVAGGGEYSGNKKSDSPFAGGAGAGFSVSPIGFAVITSGDIKIVKMEPSEIFEKLIDNIPALLALIKEKLNVDKKD